MYDITSILKKKDTEKILQHEIKRLNAGKFCDFTTSVSNVLELVNLYEQRWNVNSGTFYRDQLSELCDKYVDEIRTTQ